MAEAGKADRVLAIAAGDSSDSGDSEGAEIGVFGREKAAIGFPK
jgi:hypothetical protein